MSSKVVQELAPLRTAVMGVKIVAPQKAVSKRMSILPKCMTTSASKVPQSVRKLRGIVPSSKRPLTSTSNSDSMTLRRLRNKRCRTCKATFRSSRTVGETSSHSCRERCRHWEMSKSATMTRSKTTRNSVSSLSPARLKRNSSVPSISSKENKQEPKCLRKSFRKRKSIMSRKETHWLVKFKLRKRKTRDSETRSTCPKTRNNQSQMQSKPCVKR